jgi:hypothetical protein
VEIHSVTPLASRQLHAPVQLDLQDVFQNSLELCWDHQVKVVNIQLHIEASWHRCSGQVSDLRWHPNDLFIASTATTSCRLKEICLFVCGRRWSCLVGLMVQRGRLHIFCASHFALPCRAISHWWKIVIIHNEIANTVKFSMTCKWSMTIYATTSYHVSDPDPRTVVNKLLLTLTRTLITDPWKWAPSLHWHKPVTTGPWQWSSSLHWCKCMTVIKDPWEWSPSLHQHQCQFW